jgi:hypothetical protein
VDNLQTAEGRQKIAAINQDYVRTVVKEDGIHRNVLPFETATDADLVPQLTEDLKIIATILGDSPAAVETTLDGTPDMTELFDGRFFVTIRPIITAKFQKHLDKLRTYKDDIRTYVAEQQPKQIMTAEDTPFFAAANLAMGNAVNAVAEGGTVQWSDEFSGGLCRESYVDSLKLLMRTPSKLKPTTAVASNLTLVDFRKWKRDEMGGDYSEEMIRSGNVKIDFDGMTWIGSIKHNLFDATYPDIYYFGPREFMGKAYELQAPIMYTDAKEMWVSFWMRELVGSVPFANTNSVARAIFK